MPDEPLVRFAGLVSKWVKPQYGSNTFDDGRLACSAAAHEHVEVRVQVNACTIEESSSFPCDCDKLRVLKTAIGRAQPDTRTGIEKGLLYAFDPDFRHLDPTRSTRMFKFFGIGNITRIDHGYGQIIVGRMFSPIVRISVRDDLTNALWKILD